MEATIGSDQQPPAGPRQDHVDSGRELGELAPAPRLQAPQRVPDGGQQPPAVVLDQRPGGALREAVDEPRLCAGREPPGPPRVGGEPDDPLRLVGQLDGIYDASAPSNGPLTYTGVTTLPSLADVVVEVDVNTLDDGGLWLGSDYTGGSINGVLPVGGVVSEALALLRAPRPVARRTGARGHAAHARGPAASAVRPTSPVRRMIPRRAGERKCVTPEN